LSNVLTQLQTPVVGAVAGTYVAGLFGIASRITGPMTLLTTSVATVVVPELANRVGTPAFKQLSDKIVKLSWGYLLLTMAAAVPITLLVVAIAGRDYEAAAPLIAAMVVAAGLSGCSQAFGSGLMALDRPASATTAIAAGGVVSLVALATFGLTGDVGLLAAAPILAQIVVLVLMVLAARRLTYTAAYGPSP
jgi:O-antigen/teichoic acid export membrane protein